MHDVLKGLSVCLLLLGKALPVLILTIFLAAILSWIFGPRRYTDSAGVEKTVPWYFVAEYSRVISIVTAMSAFGTFQGYLVGSIGFEDSSKTIASLITGAVTFLSSIIALFYGKDAPESFKRSIAPGIVGFLMCFLIFNGYHDEIVGAGIPDSTVTSDTGTTEGDSK